jgi:hypothetical protein
MALACVHTCAIVECFVVSYLIVVNGGKLRLVSGPLMDIIKDVHRRSSWSFAH